MTNLLASKWGRMTAFFTLYITEGIPLGFTATAVATQMRREGLGVAEIGAFVGSLYLPWAFKWAFGPFVDVISSDRFGRRRLWIVLAQIGMIGTLMAALPVNFSIEVKLFTMLILIHNIFGATQDVAIDALAVNVLKPDERGLANGLMFGGAYLGQAIGGSGVLFLSEHIPFQYTYFFVAGCIALVTLFVAWPLREPKGPPRPHVEGSKLKNVGVEVGTFVRDSVKAFLGTRAAFVGLIVAVLPFGAFALGLALQTNLAVELGLTDSEIGLLSLYSTVISALGCVAGGWLSDRFGRRRMLALFLVGTAIPTLYLGYSMWTQGWIMPVDVTLENRPVPSPSLVTMFWAMVMVYSVFQGLYYGTKAALFMDITTPAVAATQFTAYMALSNLVISYTANWQGLALERWGYPITLTIDACVGLIVIALLPLMTPKKSEPEHEPAGAAVPEVINP